MICVQEECEIDVSFRIHTKTINSTTNTGVNPVHTLGLGQFYLMSPNGINTLTYISGRHSIHDQTTRHAGGG